MSMDFYGAQEGVTPVDRVVHLRCRQHHPGPCRSASRPVSASASRLRFPGALSHLDEEDAARLTVSYGLALEE